MSFRKCMCKRCGAVYAVDVRIAARSKWCDACKPIVRRERARESARLKAELRKKPGAEPPKRKRKHSIDDRIRQLKAEGVSYADAQKKETAALYAHVDVEEANYEQL